MRTHAAATGGAPEASVVNFFPEEYGNINLRRTKLFYGTRRTKRGNYLPQQIV